MKRGLKMEPIQLVDGVYDVGVIDWNIRDFHGYSTGRGTTYNAYLVMAEKITLIDTVKAPFFEEMMSRIASSSTVLATHGLRMNGSDRR